MKHVIKFIFLQSNGDNGLLGITFNKCWTISNLIWPVAYELHANVLSAESQVIHKEGFFSA